MPEKQPFDLQQTVKGMSDAELQQFNTWLITERYRVQAKKLQIDMPHGNFMLMDGKKVIDDLHPDGVIIPLNTNPQEVEPRLNQMGSFTQYVGTVSFVGPDGRYWKGVDSRENIEALQKACYNPGSVFVFIGEDGKFADPAVQKEWETILHPLPQVSEESRSAKEAEKRQELKESLTKNLTSDFREEEDGFVLETGSFKGYKISRAFRGGAHGYIYYAQTPAGEPAIIKVAKESASKPYYLTLQETNQIEYAVLEHTSKLLAEHYMAPLVSIPIAFDTTSYSNAAFSESLMPGEAASDLIQNGSKYPPEVILKNIFRISELGNLLAGKAFQLTLRDEAVQLEVSLERDRRPDTIFLDPKTGELTGIIDFSTSAYYTKDYDYLLKHASSSLPYQSEEYTRAEERRKQLEIRTLEGIMRHDSERGGVKSMGLMAERLSRMEEATPEIRSLFERMAAGQIPNFVAVYQEIVNQGLI